MCCPLIISIALQREPVYAKELQPRHASAGNSKGFWEVSLYTETVARSVVEEINPGVNFEGDAESTRVMAKIATKPWKPVEFYLQAGTANLMIDQFNDYRGDYVLAYGGGASLTLYEYPGPEKFQIITRADTLNFETTDPPSEPAKKTKEKKKREF